MSVYLRVETVSGISGTNNVVSLQGLKAEIGKFALGPEHTGHFV